MKFEEPPKPKIETESAKSEQPKQETELEQPSSEQNPLYETAKTATPEQKKDSFGYENIKGIIERQTGQKLPDNPEEFIDNFERLVPKDFQGLNLASQDQMLRLSKREDIKSYFEKELWGASIKDVDSYFQKKQDEASERYEEAVRELNFYDSKQLDEEYQDLQSQGIEMQNGYYEKPLLKIEKLIEEKTSYMRREYGSEAEAIRTMEVLGQYSSGLKEARNAKKELDDLRNFASRLTREVYKNKPEKKINEEMVKQELDSILTTWQQGETDNSVRKENFESIKNIKNNLDGGNFLPALEQIELSISAMPVQLEGLKSGDKLTREATEDSLKNLYGDGFRRNIDQKLEDLRRMREFLKDKIREAGKIFPEKEAGIKKETVLKPEDLKKEFGFVIHRMTVDGLLGGYTKFQFDKLSIEDQQESLEDLRRILREYDKDRRVSSDKLKEFINKVEAVRFDYFGQ
ncbi:MAG: hypothetical protein HYV52_03755 [Parcubacteria group bacterium]|nr:hypothetical protein [Parcubacteria group bacterium]